jgi:thymidylate synthase (FAD)
MIDGNFLHLKKEKVLSNTNVSWVWATPNGENLVASMARVSNPSNQDNTATAPKLLRYLIKNEHWSPFEMVNVCLKIETTRDIARQILRHRSFSFQEFSQRYAEAADFSLHLSPRLQDPSNRQNSIEVDNDYLKSWWLNAQDQVLRAAETHYDAAIKKGIAKEVARKLLPEGLTNSTMYMNGTLRSWIHYIKVRTDVSTQKEHREVAEKAAEIIYQLFPSIKEALDDTSKQ